MTIDPQRRNTQRGRPRVAGALECADCLRVALKSYRLGTRRLCGICYRAAAHQRGRCQSCGQNRLVPYRDSSDQPICPECAGDPGRFTCRSCAEEIYLYRAGQCVRCVIREDLTGILSPQLSTDQALRILLEAFCRAERPESVYTWMRGHKPRRLLCDLGSGDLQLTHDALDDLGFTRHAEHLRAVAVHHGVLAARDPYLPKFAAWIDAKIAAIDDPHIATPVEQFARWHHLRRIPCPGGNEDHSPRTSPRGQTGHHCGGQLPHLASRPARALPGHVHPSRSR